MERGPVVGAGRGAGARIRALLGGLVRVLLWVASLPCCTLKRTGCPLSWEAPAYGASTMPGWQQWSSLGPFCSSTSTLGPSSATGNFFNMRVHSRLWALAAWAQDPGFLQVSVLLPV